MSSFVEVGLSREFANRKRAPPPPSNSKPGKGAARHVNNEQKGRSQVRESFDMVFEISIHGLKLPRCRKQRLMPVIVTLPPQYADDLHVNIGMPNSDVADNFLSDGDKVPLVTAVFPNETADPGEKKFCVYRRCTRRASCSTSTSRSEASESRVR